MSTEKWFTFFALLTVAANVATIALWALGLLQVWRYRRKARAILDRAELTASARAEG